MAGGPITEACAWKRFEFDQSGNLLVYYRFDQWGYGVIEKLPEKVARRLDADTAYRTKYIKQHGYEKYKVATTSKPELTNDGVHSTMQLAEYITAYAHRANGDLFILTNLECPHSPSSLPGSSGFVAKLIHNNEKTMGCYASTDPGDVQVAWVDGKEETVPISSLQLTKLGEQYKAQQEAASSNGGCLATGIK